MLPPLSPPLPGRVENLSLGTGRAGMCTHTHAPRSPDTTLPLQCHTHPPAGTAAGTSPQPPKHTLLP
jgi:hypothetical protein